MLAQVLPQLFRDFGLQGLFAHIAKDADDELTRPFSSSCRTKRIGRPDAEKFSRCKYRHERAQARDDGDSRTSRESHMRDERTCPV